MTPEEEKVTLQIRGNVAIITLSDPKKLNAMNQDSTFRMAYLLNQVAEMDEVSVTVIIGTGHFFSAGADVTVPRKQEGSQYEQFKFWARTGVSNNLFITRAFYAHPKILITALNGPVVGILAALISHADFIYAAPHTYLLVPFTSLGLMAEGAASRSFVDRLGVSKANEALLTSRRVYVDDLLKTGFVNKVFSEGGGDPKNGKGSDSLKFLEAVLAEIDDKFGPREGGHLNHYSLQGIKKMIRKPGLEKMDVAGLDEVWGLLDVFSKGIPQKEFAKIASGEKRHKL